MRNEILRKVSMSAGLAMLFHGGLELASLAVLHQMSLGHGAASTHAVALLIVILVGLFFAEISIYSATGVLAAYLLRPLGLSKFRSIVMGACAAAAGGILPKALFAAIQAIAEQSIQSPFAQLMGREPTDLQVWSVFVAAVAAARSSCVVGGFCGGCAAAIYNTWFNRNGPAM